MAAIGVQNAATGTANSLALALNGITAGSLIVVCMHCRSTGGCVSVSGTLNGSYTQAVASAAENAVFYFMNSASGNESLTLTFSGGPTANYGEAFEFTGIATTGALDQTNSNTNASGTSHSCGSITTTGAGVIVASAETGGAVNKTPDDAGFTKIAYTPADASRPYSAYKISSGAETNTGSFTTNAATASYAAIANFLDVGGGGGGQPARARHALDAKRGRFDTAGRLFCESFKQSAAGLLVPAWV